MNEKDSQDISWLIVGALGLFGLWRIWTLYVRPWLIEQWTQLRGSAAAGDFDGVLVDVIGVTAMALPFLLLLLLVRVGRRRRRRRAATESDDPDAPTQPTKKTKTAGKTKKR